MLTGWGARGSVLEVLMVNEAGVIMLFRLIGFRSGSIAIDSSKIGCWGNLLCVENTESYFGELQLKASLINGLEVLPLVRVTKGDDEG